MRPILHLKLFNPTNDHYGLSPIEAAATAIELRADLEQVEALAIEREALWTRLDKATFLTTAEKRTAGFDGSGDDVEAGTKYSPDQPRVPRGRTGGGQWTARDEGEEDDGFTTDPDRPFGVTPDGTPVQPAAFRPRGGPPKQPAPPSRPVEPGPRAGPAEPRADFGATQNGRRHTAHSHEQSRQRGFTDDKIDAIVDDNKRVSNGVDSQGRKTWRHTDNRGNTVILNEEGGIVSVFSGAQGGHYIPKP